MAPVNNYFHSMFSSIDLYLNNKLVTSNMDTYPYRAYLENLFSFGFDVKQNQLKAGEFWYQDTTGKFVDWGDSDTIKARMAAVEESKPLELMGRLHLDLAMQEKYLPNGIEIRLRLNRASPQFCLMVGEGGGYPSVVKIDVAKVSVRTLQLLPAITIDLNQAIAQKQAKFPIRRVEVKTFTINTGLRTKIEDHFFHGQLLKRLFIGMVTNEEFNGSYASNPFRFTPFRLSKLDVSCDVHNIYGRPFEPNFRDDQYLRSYISLYQALSSQNQVQNCNISFQDFKDGYCFWGFDLTPDQEADQSHLHRLKTGNLRLELQFARALDVTINVIVYAEFDSLIEINGLREVTTYYLEDAPGILH